MQYVLTLLSPKFGKGDVPLTRSEDFAMQHPVIRDVCNIIKQYFVVRTKSYEYHTKPDLQNP